MKKYFKAGTFIFFSFILILTVSHAAIAQDEEQTKVWEDTAELSYVQTGGNTDILTFSGSNTLKYNYSEQWKATWGVAALYGKTDGVITAEHYSTDLRTDYKTSTPLFYYAKAGWLQDSFAGIDKRLYIGPGAGYQFLNGEQHFLSAEAGLNMVTENYPDGTDGQFMEGRLFGSYDYVFNPKTKFSQIAEYLYNFDDGNKYRVNATTSLTTMLTDLFSLKVSYAMAFQNEPTPETLDQTDTIFSVALVVNF
jgi:putative salt-induced outer membrane protein